MTESRTREKKLVKAIFVMGGSYLLVAAIVFTLRDIFKSQLEKP